MSNGCEDLSGKRRFTYIALAAATLLLYEYARHSSWQGTTQLHTLIELATTLLALIVGILALVRFYSKKLNTFLFVATGFLGAGLLDGYHAVVSSPAFKQFFPSPPPSLIPWSGFASRLFLAVLVWLSWAFWKREDRLGPSGTVRESRVYLIVGLWMLACFSFFVFFPLPLAYKKLPLFHRPQEVLPAFFLVMALVGYVRKGRWKRDPFEHWLVLSIMFCVAQALYMSTSDKLYDMMYITSHLLKIASYICTLTGLIVAMYYLFLGEEEVVAERTEKLQVEIRQRKRAQEESLELLHREQEALRKSREEQVFSNTVIESFPGVVCIFNAAGKVLRWNTNFLGYSASEAFEVGIQGTVAEESRELTHHIIEQAFETGAAQGEAVLLAKNGKKVSCYLTGARIAFNHEDCILGVAIDISKRKLAEEQVRLQAAALNSAANSIVITDAKGTIEWVNPAFTRLTGYKLEEAVGQNPRILKSGKQDEAFYRRLWSTIVAGETWSSEITNRRKDGQLYAEEMTIAPVRSATGEISNYVAIKQDVTQRKRTQTELTRAKELAEAANRAKSEFLANMSHELRTPLNGIMGMTELALETELSPEQREFLTMSQASAESLLSLINDILDFSKIEAGKLEFEAIDFNLRNNLETTLKVLAPRAHEKGLELNCHVHAEVPEILKGDPSRLRQIVVNLVGNAIKFTQRGEVSLDVKREPEQTRKVVVHFQVTDTGIGIPQDRQEVIFDAFAQADGSTTRRYGGSGLGLTVSRQLVAMFGGRLWLESVVGQGSTFHFTVELEAGADSGWNAPLRPAKLEGLAALVVDDNNTNRRILEEMLTGWHMKPTVTDDAGNALHLVRAAADSGRPFPLLLVDAKMPKMDGFTLIEQIKQSPRLATATIMMLTSAGQIGDAARCRELGVAAYLTKPIGRTELMSAILQVLGDKPKGSEQFPALVTRHSLRDHTKGLRILLAEDNLVNRLVTVRLLEKQGHTLDIAVDGNEAVAKGKAGNFDLILMDVQMPGMDGFEATAALREIDAARGRHVPIIAMTAHALKGDRERCLAAGMDGYISKPFKVEELLTQIENLPELSMQTG